VDVLRERDIVARAQSGKKIKSLKNETDFVAA
jgi:hypothetical protein